MHAVQGEDDGGNANTLSSEVDSDGELLSRAQGDVRSDDDQAASSDGMAACVEGTTKGDHLRS